MIPWRWGEDETLWPRSVSVDDLDARVVCVTLLGSRGSRVGHLAFLGTMPTVGSDPRPPRMQSSNDAQTLYKSILVPHRIRVLSGSSTPNSETRQRGSRCTRYASDIRVRFGLQTNPQPTQGCHSLVSPVACHGAMKGPLHHRSGKAGDTGKNGRCVSGRKHAL